MSRYIDADALKETIMDMRNHCEPSPCLPHQTMLIPDRMVADKIDAMPTVDAVQVVKCRECKRWTNPIPIEMKKDGYGYCVGLWTNTHENEYCAWGKRRFVE